MVAIVAIVMLVAVFMLTLAEFVYVLSVFLFSTAGFHILNLTVFTVSVRSSCTIDGLAIMHSYNYYRCCKQCPPDYFGERVQRLCR